MITHRCACQKSYTSIIITSIIWAGPRCVQEACAGGCCYFRPSKPHSGTLWTVMLQLPPTTVLLQLQYLFISFSIHLYLYLYRVCRAPFPQSKKLSESVMINKTAQQQQSEAGSRAGPPSQLGYRTRTHNQCSGGKTSEYSTCSPMLSS